MKSLALLGSTGSIGRQTLDVVEAFPEDFRVLCLTAHRQVERMVEQIERHRPELVVMVDEEAARRVEAQSSRPVTVLSGEEGLERAARWEGVDTVVTSVVGSVGIRATLAAIDAGKDLALANKETLVAAGALVMPALRRAGTRLMPIDSEHSALFQCLNGERSRDVKRLLLTCSGGPFRGWTSERLETVTPEQALGHPNWNMGAKITIDSATLMNKGLEVIEAMWLYDLPVEGIDVVVHPESIVHSCVDFVDGSVMAQLGRPDMRIPIQYALTWPERRPNPELPRLDLTSCGPLHFEKPDRLTFPCLDLAYEAARAGGCLPAIMNGANEVVVHAFLEGRAAFLDIPRRVEAVMTAMADRGGKRIDLEGLLAADAEARRRCAEGLASR